VEAKWVGKKGEDAVDGTLKITEFGHEAIDGLSEYEVSDADEFVAGQAIHTLSTSPPRKSDFCELDDLMT
jgi:hypothetical protein